ncbi:MAG TPA: acyl-CoA dehydrogenase C-terminal domain-containing protein, partial [Acidimicrobiia bacterium]|nr:acyl-CoA dehydrogenase C-terminal domain-containing protein [Acidimicrobiia bacterium]
GIQAADLVGRKLGMRAGGVITDLLDEFGERADALDAADGMAAFGERLRAAVADARRASAHLMQIAPDDPRSLLAGSTPYLRLLGTTVCAGLLAKGALAASGDDPDSVAKRASARFFGEQILPTVAGLLPAITADAAALYELDAAQLATN